MRTSRCLVVTGPERMDLREYPLPAIGPREMLLKVEMVSISGRPDRAGFSWRAVNLVGSFTRSEPQGRCTA